MSETRGRLEADGASLAWRRVGGRGRTLVWLGGFRSEMAFSEGSTTYSQDSPAIARRFRRRLPRC